METLHFNDFNSYYQLLKLYYVFKAMQIDPFMYRQSQ